MQTATAAPLNALAILAGSLNPKKRLKQLRRQIDDMLDGDSQ